MVLRKGATAWLLEETATYFLLKQSVLLGVSELNCSVKQRKIEQTESRRDYLLCRGAADLSRAWNRVAMHGKLSSISTR